MDMNHLVLLGDSIFDNRAYVAGGPAVIDQVKQRVPHDWQATLLAVDGDTAADVLQQLKQLPQNATYLVLSVGGNDALNTLQHLGRPAENVIGALAELSGLLATFRHSYRSVLTELLALNRPVMVCTVYDAVPGLTDTLKVALGMFNDVILREAIRFGLPVLDLRMICTGTSDYSQMSPIEPSSQGGAKLAEKLVATVLAYDLMTGGCHVYS
jgi:hypothetical protein